MAHLVKLEIMVGVSPSPSVSNVIPVAFLLNVFNY